MATFVMLIKMSPDLAKNFKSMEEIGKKVGAKYREACPQVQVREHLALLGPYDFLDILEAPNEETAFKMAAVTLPSPIASLVDPLAALAYQNLRDLTRRFAQT